MFVCNIVAAVALKRHKNPKWTVWKHTPLRHWMATVEDVVSHSWFRCTPGRLSTALVAFSLVTGLSRSPEVYFGVADQRWHSKVDFVRQLKLATDPRDGIAGDRMSRSAP